jgi:hypothetical protein
VLLVDSVLDLLFNKPAQTSDVVLGASHQTITIIFEPHMSDVTLGGQVTGQRTQPD